MSMTHDITTSGPVIVWLRNDLRVTDNASLAHAVDSKRPVIPVFVYSPDEEEAWPPGAASRWWLHHSLMSLSASLKQLGSKLIFRTGRAAHELSAVAAESGATTLVYSRRWEPAAIRQQRMVESELTANRIDVRSVNNSLLFEPTSIATASGTPYRVFTPFYRSCLTAWAETRPIAAPSNLLSPTVWPNGVSVEDLQLLPRINWAGGLHATWTPGETGAQAQLETFAHGAASRYLEIRDMPAVEGVSRLSPFLHFGEISPRQVVSEISRAAINCTSTGSHDGYVRQLVWREFAHHLLYHYPHTADQPLRSEFANFPWKNDLELQTAWRQGRTGYPLVDAGMRELWRTGYVHNRVRMVVASFLVKDLLIPWQEGARWFWDTLVDADLANNTLGWQWVAGCGADAAPYFRIFNPVSQAQKFDPTATYIRRWVPELAELSVPEVHDPWHFPLLAASTEYPDRIVEHDYARARALESLEAMKVHPLVKP